MATSKTEITVLSLRIPLTLLQQLRKLAAADRRKTPDFIRLKLAEVVEAKHG